MSVGGYDGMHLIYEALKKTGGKADGDSLIAAMKGMKWESPRGPISIDPETRDIMQNIYIRKVEKKNGQLYNVEFQTFEAVKDPARQWRRNSSSMNLSARRPNVAARTSPSNGGSIDRQHLVICRRAVAHDIPEASRYRGANMLTILFDGIAYGMLLFVLASGLAVTLGLMNFINLAHGSFAMAGGYVTVVLVNRLGVPFFASLPTRLSGERRYRIRVRAHALCACLQETPPRPGAVHHRPRIHVGGRGRLCHGLQSGLRAGAQLALQGQFDISGIGIGRYRLLIIVICGLLTVALQFILAYTRFGSRLRAAVDDSRVASGLGINVNWVFALTFAFGSGLAGLGGALGAEILGLDPTFPLKFMIYFLIVVTVGGTSSITGPFLASLLLGIGDVAGKYYVPTLGSFVIYTIMIVVLIWRPQGLFSRAASR